MSSAATIYESCLDSELDISQCVSDAFEAVLASKNDTYETAINTSFLLFGGALIYFMQTGFAMLTAGSVRQKNCKNVLLWNLLDSCAGAVGYWSVGYAFAFGGDNFGGPTTFIGHENFFLTGDVELIFWFFNFAFACTLSSIVAGTVAERCQMTAYLLYSYFICGFVYPVVTHQIWSVNGFLSAYSAEPLWGNGVIDLAGSGPVHMCGGVSALAAAIILGPRKGRFYDDDGNPLETPREYGPHSVALQFLGTFCLWFGWYGFNPCSVLKVTAYPETTALVAVNTTLAAATGAISAMFLESFLYNRKTGLTTYDLGYTMNGCLTGLAAITAPCATIEPWAAVVIGITAGFLYCLASKTLIRFKIDDAVDAIPVHMVGGAWGVLSAGLFSNPYRMEAFFGRSKYVGWFYEWGRGSANFNVMGLQIIAVIFIFSWTFVVMGIFFYILQLMNVLRMDPLEEEAGMDISRHKGAAYDITPPSENVVQELVQRRSDHGSRHKKNGSILVSEPQNALNGNLPKEEP